MSTSSQNDPGNDVARWLEQWVKGPTRTRWDRIPLQSGDPAPDFELLDSTGVPRRLGEAWNGSPALLLFWRHYGCSCGRERAAWLKSEYAQYVELGATVVVIGYGEPARAAAYAKRHEIPCLVLCDPAFQAYQGYDLLEGKPSQIVFDATDAHLQCDVSAWKELVESRQGTERAILDNPWQLPGEFVVDKHGTVRLAYRYQYCEDWPDPRVLVAALKEALWDTD